MNSDHMSSSEVIIGELLRKEKKTLSAAESCTGGRVSDKITNIPGSSDYFMGSAVTYSNEAKSELLGVNPESLKAYGAVSEQVAKEMALGCRRKFHSDIGMSTTGIAGPSGGSKEKPVGLVWFAVTDGGRTMAEEKTFSGDRIAIKEAAAAHAISLAIDFVKNP